MWRLLSRPGFHSYNITFPIFLTMKQKFIRSKTLLKYVIWHLYIPKHFTESAYVVRDRFFVEDHSAGRAIVKIETLKFINHAILAKTAESVHFCASNWKWEETPNTVCSVRWPSTFFFRCLWWSLPAQWPLTFQKSIFRISLQAAEFPFERLNLGVSALYFQSHQTAIKP